MMLIAILQRRESATMRMNIKSSGMRRKRLQRRCWWFNIICCSSFGGFLINVDCYFLSVISLFWTKCWLFQKVRRRIRRKFDKEEEKLEGGGERRKRGQKDGKKGRERDFRVTKWIYKQWPKSFQTELAHERWDTTLQLCYLFVIITYKYDQNQMVGLWN